jgi:hypothetical protein
MSRPTLARADLRRGEVHVLWRSRVFRGLALKVPNLAVSIGIARVVVHDVFLVFVAAKVREDGPSQGADHELMLKYPRADRYCMTRCCRSTTKMSSKPERMCTELRAECREV